jgi:acetyl-CoA carboxylase carboxyltransferase component
MEHGACRTTACETHKIAATLCYIDAAIEPSETRTKLIATRARWKPSATSTPEKKHGNILL